MGHKVDSCNTDLHKLFYTSPLCYPEDVPGCHVYDMRRILVPVVEFEFIYPKEAGVMLRLHEFSSLT